MYNVCLPEIQEKKQCASGERATSGKEKNKLRHFQTAVWTSGLLL